MTGLKWGLCFAFLLAGCDRSPDMNEKAGIVTMKGTPLTLVGSKVEVGDSAEDFEVIANDMSSVKFSSFLGKICVISSVPSLDTPVCDVQTRRFNQEAGELGSDVVILTISTDLPFAQKRWCGAAGVSNVVTLSDYRDGDFGHKYGVLIKDLRLLGRAVFVVDRKGVVRYTQVVGEITEEPDYDKAIEAVRKLL